jgi:hypothetical protein
MKKLKNRKELLEKVPKKISIAELGVFEGDFSKEIYEIISPSLLYLVDLFDGIVGSGDKDGNNFKYVDMGESYKKMINHFDGAHNVNIIKSASYDFLGGLLNDSLDAVYIDADHSYNAVKGDIYSAYAKVKIGGCIMGHDYCRTQFPGVVAAIDEFCVEFNQMISYITDDGCPSFLIHKQ